MAIDSDESDSKDAPAKLFDATRWSIVLRARDKSEVALNSLCQNYRQPLIVWLRGRGYSPNDAEDLVQGLFEKLLRHDFLKNVVKEKGRFRTFMKSCLMNYLRDQHAKNSAERRGSGQPTESLDATFDGEDKIHDPADPSATPDAAFDRAWVSSLLANALRRLHEECARQGRAALWGELEPVISQDETASRYREIGIRLGMSEASVKMAASRIRARLRGLIWDEIKQTVSNEQEWQSEAQYLMQIYGR